MVRLHGLMLLSLLYLSVYAESTMVVPESLRILTSSAETNDDPGLVSVVEPMKSGKNPVNAGKGCQSPNAKVNIGNNKILVSNSVLNSDGSFTLSLEQMKSIVEINGSLRNINGSYSLEIAGVYRRENYNVCFFGSEESGFEVRPYVVPTFITVKTISTIAGK